MSEAKGSSREDRYLRALHLKGEYLARVASGTAEPLAEFLASHPAERRLLASWLDAGTLPSSGEGADASREPSGAVDDVVDRIGPYRIIARLGRGGMGSVYLGERQDPAQRVAIKVVQSELISAAFADRFRDECRALARMNHDAIARVFDTGTTHRGEPFLVMELVEGGQPLHRWCDQHALPIGDRIGLFLRACDGVQHAHLKGIAHRDLKPGNVLVADQDGRAVVKIIDFGIAAFADEAVGVAAGAGSGQPLPTRPGGTPEYMSPEQARGVAGEIDLRTDVYSLGVMLYQLLSGELPFASDAVRDLHGAALYAHLTGVVPPTPSTRVAREGGTGTAPAARGTTARRLARALRGDLDWIVRKAMAAEVDQRYASVGELAADLRRHLAHEAVLAAPPSVRYLFGRAFVRHRRGVAAVGAVVLLAVSGVLALTWRNEAMAAQRGRSELESGVRRASIVAGLARIRRLPVSRPVFQNDEVGRMADPGMEAAEAAEQARRAYQAVLVEHGLDAAGTGLDALFAADTDLRRQLLDELYWLQPSLRRVDPLGEIRDDRLTRGRVEGWLNAWEVRPWRRQVWEAVRHGPLDAAGIVALVPQDLRVVATDDLEWLSMLLPSVGLTSVEREVFDEVNRRNPGCWWVHLYLATKTSGIERMKHAQSMKVLAPDRTETWYNYGWNYQFIKEPPFGDEAAADRAYRRVLELDPGHWQACLNLTYLVSVEEGIALTQRALATRPDATLYHRLLERLRSASRCEEAIEVGQRAIGLYPDHAGILAMHGECLGWLSRFAEAVPLLERAAQLAPQEPAVRANLITVVSGAADQEQDQGRRAALRQRAVQVAEQAVRDFPGEGVFKQKLFGVKLLNMGGGRRK